MPKKVTYEYDYSKITLNFRKDIETQKKGAELLSSVPAHSRTNFVSELITDYMKRFGIVDERELAKRIKKGNLFEGETALPFTDAQENAIRALIRHELEINDYSCSLMVNERIEELREELGLSPASSSDKKEKSSSKKKGKDTSVKVKKEEPAEPAVDTDGYYQVSDEEAYAVGNGMDLF